jgi:hypothetical protein
MSVEVVGCVDRCIPDTVLASNQWKTEQNNCTLMNMIIYSLFAAAVTCVMLFAFCLGHLFLELCHAHAMPTRTLDPCIAGALRYLESKHISTHVEFLYILERTHQETRVLY